MGLQLVQLANIIQLAVLIIFDGGRLRFSKSAQMDAQCMLKTCSNSAYFWAVFGALQGRIGSREVYLNN